MAQCVEYYYSWKKERKLAKLASAPAQVSGKKMEIRQEGQGTGRRGEKPLASQARRRSARITSSPALGKARQMLPQGFLVLLP